MNSHVVNICKHCTYQIKFLFGYKPSLHQINFWYISLFPIIYIYTVWFQLLHRINAAFGVSSKFVPYRPNWDLVSSATNIVENSLKPWANLKSGDNLDNVISMMSSKGVWRMFAAGTNDVLNKPTSGIFFVRTLMVDTNTGIQIVTMLTGNDRGKSYSRTYAGGWDSWKETTNV